MRVSESFCSAFSYWLSGVPLILAAAGITLCDPRLITALAIGLITVAVVLAIGYLVLVGIRTLLRNNNSDKDSLEGEHSLALCLPLQSIIFMRKF